jgi:hypothetical protein
VVLALTHKFKIKLPESLRWGIAGWKGVGVLETKDVKLVLDLGTPTDRQVLVGNTRPGLQVYLKRSKHLAILEVTCAWEPLVLERERKKRGKYREFACDLVTQLVAVVGWRVTVHPLVVGDWFSGQLGN